MQRFFRHKASPIVHLRNSGTNLTCRRLIEHVGDMMELCNEHRGIQLDYHYDEASGRSTLRYELPLSEIATEFFSKLKSR
jgi:translation elongation factor EF-4